MTPSGPSTTPPILEVKDLAISYQTRKRDVPAVRGVSFTVGRQETVGLVGESGCGKSTIAFGILDFLGTNGKVVGGSIRFNGEELVGRPKAELRRIRGNQISMVYQDPMQALNPSLKIGRQLAEVLTTHQEMTLDEAWQRSIQMLDRVYMPDAANVMNRYPHMISGGQQQRVVIAMAMLNNPALLIMDEPTTALDVTVEAAVLDLIEDLKKDFNTGIIFITHNLGVVARVSDRLCVMYAGEMVEKGPIGDMFAQPAHPYTRGLLCCIPRLTDDLAYTQLWSIRGRVPPPAERAADRCIFQPRCDWADEQCSRSHPELVDISPDHQSRCFRGKETLAHSLSEYSRGKRRTLAVSDNDADELPEETLSRLENVKVYYEQESSSLKSLFGMGEKRYVKAVDDISLRIRKGCTVGVVGESGCGKSTLVKGLIGLERLTDGKAQLMGLDISDPVSRRDLSLIKELQMVFQNPDSTLNPSFSIGKQIGRPIRRFKTGQGAAVRQEVERLLRSVKLAGYYYDRYPRQLSGGEKQRVGIARALASNPNMVICDEPVSALDVSVQAAVLNLLNEIKEEFGTTMIFIAHDLSVVRFISDYIAVMYLGQIVEFGPVDRIYPPPYHPYTEALLSSVPVPDPLARRRQIRLSGDVPSALNPPPGCRFHTRCPRREMAPDNGAICALQPPPWQKVKGEHRIFCHIPVEQLAAMAPVVPQSKPAA
ncbi:ABC transporter ATP-binding protein [Desulfosarcina alkanivorans]|uniref:ABC transporter ATP-binding protein n=1 Tax=Desulfosarcina alkanivorans TaxID=571177 RepID=A0A5K7YQL3_9BACT|nr:ABC transporter ATP-binding protein [Desulfosarcina alkanivorans]BBO70615.1 ABC transporter ATP-binding protein [Desulfosarcina alkanivorans]